MNGITEQDRVLRSRARGAAAAVLTIFLTGMIALGTPPDAEEAVEAPPAAMAPAETAALTPAAPVAYEPAVYSPEGMPWQWQWDPSDY